MALYTCGTKHASAIVTVSPTEYFPAVLDISCSRAVRQQKGKNQEKIEQKNTFETLVDPVVTPFCLRLWFGSEAFNALEDGATALHRLNARIYYLHQLSHL